MHAMVITFLYNCFEKENSSHINVLYPNPCYNDVFYKGSVHSTAIIQAWS